MLAETLLVETLPVKCCGATTRTYSVVYVCNSIFEPFRLHVQYSVYTGLLSMCIGTCRYVTLTL